MTESNTPQAAWPPKTADGAFATTQWSMIMEAAREADDASARALAKLCQAYWLPVYAFVRKSGNGREQSEDLTQGFFANLIEKRSFKSADPARGTFRSYLLGSLKFFVSNQHQKSIASKRGGGAAHVSFEVNQAEQWIAPELANVDSPDVLFERQWSRLILDRVMQQLREEYRRRGKEALFETLQPFMSGGRGEASYQEVAEAKGNSVASIKMAASRMRQRFGDLLREHVAETVQAPADVDEELRNLLRAFQR